MGGFWPAIRKYGAVKVELRTCQEWINVFQIIFQLCTVNCSQIFRIQTTVWPIARMASSVTAPKISSWTTERYELVANNSNQMNFSRGRKLFNIFWEFFVARYCVPDPCTSTGCIRKCCPSDMALVTKYYHDLDPIAICEPYPEKLNLSLLRNPQNQSIDERAFFTSGGLGMKCGDVGVDAPYDLSSFCPLIADGPIYFTHSYLIQEGENSDKYCVDNFIDNETNNIMVLGCLSEQGEDSKGALFFGYLHLFSAFFLIATFAIYSLLPKMRNIHGVILMCYLASMTVMYIFHAILMLVRGSDMPTGLCPTIAIPLHFAYMATFSWLNVLCYGVWRMFSSIKPPTQRSVFGHQFLYYSIYGWGIPFIVVVVGQILQHSDVPDCIIKPGFNSKSFCWFNHKHRGPLIAYLYAPMIVMIGFNVVMFIWATFIFYRRSAVESSKVTNISRKNQRFKVILSLFLLMGVPWTTEIITFLADSSFESALFTDIFNIISPIFIFIIFICKPSVWKMLKLKYPRLNPVFTACEQMGSRIIHPKKSNRHPGPASSGDSQSKLE
uniref:G-protein coupled receptors family 2 profile 2 domain-containing protein n=1 Tax=Daphnia galeata TaxID=27404 RepID=A0A8J2S0H0_9CRUS|nr:unnamed protein product [Daphnia galeata]